MPPRSESESKDCDGVRRRHFVAAGLFGCAQVSLAELLRRQGCAADAEVQNRRAAVIFVELAGGPSQFETYDPKPLAPKEYRGEFQAIGTSLAGVQFCECFAEQSKIAERLTVIRSIWHKSNSHDPSSHLAQTGYYKRGEKGGPNEMPSLGAVTGRFRGPNHPALPPYVAIPQIMRNGGAAQLGPGYEPFQTIADPNSPKFEVRNLSLIKGLSAERLDDRGALLARLESERRIVDLHGSADALDQFTRQALDLVTGSRTREAFDIGRENPSLREAYGRNTVGQSLLLARRLVEAGVACVTVRVTGWDDHVALAKNLRPRAVNFDRGISALVADLHQRGLDRDVLVVAMGEFGRTPKINANAGRDHWGAVMSVLLAGGGLKTGVFGESNGKGEVPVRLRYRPENVLATIYRHLGIDPQQTYLDHSGRPRYILEEREIIREIV